MWCLRVESCLMVSCCSRVFFEEGCSWVFEMLNMILGVFEFFSVLFTALGEGGGGRRDFFLY